MSVDSEKQDVQDLVRINVYEVWELNIWANKFGVTPPVIKEAAHATGPLVKNIRVWLQNHGYIKEIN